MCVLNPTRLFHDGSRPIALSLGVLSQHRPVCVFQNTVLSLTPGCKNVSLFSFLCFLSLSGSSGGKHSYSVPDQQSRAWQDSSTVDQEIRHIDGARSLVLPYTPTRAPPPSSRLPFVRPSFLHSSPAPPQFPITRRSVKIQEKQLYNVQQIFIAFTIRTSVYMSYWFYPVFLPDTDWERRQDPPKGVKAAGVEFCSCRFSSV